MAKYRIPQQYLDGFEKISALNTEQIKIIADILNSTEFGLDKNKIVESIIATNSLNEFDSSGIKTIVNTIYSIIRLDEKDKEEQKIRIKNLTESIIHYSDELNEDSTEKLHTYLNILFAISGKTKQTIKGIELLNSNQRNFIDSRIITDLRVVFDDDVDDTKVKNAVIVHNLKINFIENNGTIKESFFALDTNDIISLKNTLDRAIRKEHVLRNDGGIDNLNLLTLESSK